MNFSKKLNFLCNEKFIITTVFAWLFITYFLIICQLLPLVKGFMGHDYSLFLPMFIDNYFWFVKNGLFSPPWFSPAFCGGQVNFADPQSMYYSIPQFLIFADFDLLDAIRFSVLLFSAAGFCGMYLLTKKVFNFNNSASLLCAAIFMYNDFFIYRMVVGHMTFQGFMLTPLIAYYLLKNSNSSIKRLLSVVLAGILIGYWYLSGMAIIIVPCIISVITIALMLAIWQKKDIFYFLNNLLVAALLGIALSASKLVGSIALMRIFPRTEYPLPGFSSIIDILNIFMHSLFGGSIVAAELAYPLWENLTLPMPPHEMAFGLTCIPVFILIIFFCYIAINYLNKSTNWKPRLSGQHTAYMAILLFILLLPIAVTYYNQSWNAFLKTLPIISETASPQRWMLIYMFAIILVMGMSINSLPKKIGALLLVLSVVALPIFAEFDPKTDTIIKVYPLDKLTTAFNQAKENKANRKILFNGIISPYGLAGRNYFSVEGYDVLNCYNPTYGYFYEKISFDSIYEGETLSEIKPGILNVRNPACIIYPTENNCNLWDNFSSQQMEAATAFVSYAPFDFKRSTSQQIADILTEIAWLISVSILAGYYLYYFSSAMFKKSQ